ncbi:MAG: NADH-quinone oxidoreductase subunit N [Bacteroidales bacterium]|nr:NADH-quinone oxidoreductase subunit N [Bacteroidales bacterium]
MNLSNMLLMRNELVLILVILILIIADIFVADKNKKAVNYIAVGLFAVHTLIGFIPLKEGALFGGMFVTNSLVWGFKNILNVGVLLIILLAVSWLNKNSLRNRKIGEFYILIFSSLLGMFYLISSRNFLMLYLSLELSTLPVTALAAYDIFNRKSSEAGIKLILSAALSSGIFLFGMSLLYATGGSLYFDALTGNIGHSYLSIAGLVMFFAGLAFKISLVPFHFWTADVYEGAPTPVSNYLSVISKSSAVFILMITLFVTLNELKDILIPMLYGISILTMFIGNFFALRQQNLKRFLAFSSVAQAGFIMMGMLAADHLAASSVIYFLAIYIFSNIGAFGVVQAVSLASGKENISDYNGLYRTNPKISLILMISLFSLAGIPPIAGFFGKFFLYTAAAGKGYYLLVFIAVVNVTISLYYYLLVVRAAFLRRSENPIPYFKSDIFTKIGLIIVVIALFFLGLYSPFYDYIDSVTHILNI